MKIAFDGADVAVPSIPKRAWKSWLEKIPAQEGKKLLGLQYIFCSDTYLLDINIRYLDHDTLTDIITFDNAETEGEIEGDIFISIDRVKENAIKFKVPFEKELARVLAHGALHLCGYGDKTASEVKIMRQKEDFYIAQSPAGNHATSLKK